MSAKSIIIGLPFLVCLTYSNICATSDLFIPHPVPPSIRSSKYENILAALTIYKEAGSDGFESMLAVAEVIKNRTRSQFRSNGSVASTILRPKQFSCWNSRTPNLSEYNQVKMRDSMRAWILVLQGVSIVGPDVMHYFNPRTASPSWSKWYVQSHEIGSHVYLRTRKISDKA